MAFLRQWRLILFVLVLSGGKLLASEEHDFAAANAAFQAKLWSRAEVAFAQFIEQHPKSQHVPQAMLMQAQADYKQGKLEEAIELLQGHEATAGKLADQFAYWMGMAQFQKGDNSAAAQTFAVLAWTFTNSPWRLDAVVNEAAANANLGQWEKSIALLQKGYFQEAARTNATDDRVLNGRLLLAESLLSEQQPDEATAVLQSGAAFKDKPVMDWRRLYLLYRAELAAGDTNAALGLTTNLIETANSANRSDLRAQSVAEQAGLLKNLGQWSAALLVYEENLTNGAPEDRQREAILQIADLSAAQTNFFDAENSLENFQSRFPKSREADSVLLALGELYLKNYVASSSTNTDNLTQAQSYFDQFIGTFTNSPFLGKAYLDRGWCFWIARDWANSAGDFEAATELLAPSVDLAVAHFKLADAEFRLNDLTNAQQNYQAVVQDFTNYPVVGEALGAQAYYQSLRIALQLDDISTARDNLGQILKIYPVSNVTAPSILLVGQAMSDLGQPANARALFEKFAEEYPNSDQLPEVEVDIALTYQQEQNWPLAISIYDSWVNKYTNNIELPDVAYARAWANFQGGQETNAFLQFTNFLVEYPSNVMVPVVQWWLGDYYYGKGDWRNAEYNYELVPQSSSPLAPSLSYQAMLMAARSAVGRGSYGDATNYLLSLLGEGPSLPAAYDAQALFNYGDILMLAPSPDTNDPLANFKLAIQYFQEVCKDYSGSEYAVYATLALGEMGNCYYQLGAQDPQYYAQATNDYVQITASPVAEIAARSQAQIGIGMVYEKLAALTNSASQTRWRESALDNYLDVFYGNNLRPGETATPLWVKEAGQDALTLMETLGTGDPNKFIDQMETVFPEKKEFLEKKRLQIPAPKASE